MKPESNLNRIHSDKTDCFRSRPPGKSGLNHNCCAEMILYCRVEYDFQKPPLIRWCVPCQFPMKVSAMDAAATETPICSMILKETSDEIPLLLEKSNAS